jgi:A/G-specific adenine glycosylase
MKSSGPSAAADRAGIAAALGAWFDAEARDLPWRRTHDPYAIWVSEVMLQQTRVDTVLGYFSRFLRAWPTVRALARAAPSAVLAVWSGLGYYRRARGLLDGARYVVSRLGGELPKDAAGLREIPGIGRYTAGAVASIAFGAREPVVDGNVARVLARLFALSADIRSAEGLGALWALAGSLVPADRPGRHNEALMELGATVCLATSPACAKCPVAGFCRARRRGLVSRLPIAKKKAPVRTVSLVALVARRGGSVLLARRSPGGLFAGLWEPPMVEGAPGTGAERLLCELLGVRSIAPSYGPELTHLLTHRRLVVRIAEVRIGAAALRARPPYDRLAWRRVSRSPLSTLARKLLDACPGPPSRV